MPGDVSFLEMGTKDPAISRTFFETLFSWSFTPMGAAGAGWFQAPRMRIGLHGEDPQPQLYVFFGVADLADSVRQVRAAGGEASEPGAPEADFGRFSFCKDPQGVPFGLHELPAGC